MSVHVLVRVEGRGLRWVYFDREPISCGCEGTLEGWVRDELGEEVEFEIVRVKRDGGAAPVGTRTLRVVSYERVYGGPEEGGWWYSVEQEHRSFVVPASSFARHRARLERYCEAANYELDRREDRLSVVTGEKRKQGRPHYC